jgi:hypothetical protein
VFDLDKRSLRKPSKPSIYNLADKIERFLQEDNHETWGWVIYRSTCESENDWNAILSPLRAKMHDVLEVDNGTAFSGPSEGHVKLMWKNKEPHVPNP